MSITKKIDDLPLDLTMSHMWSFKVPEPKTTYQKCLNFCSSAFGQGIIRGDKKAYLLTDPRHYLFDDLSEVATDGEDIGISLLIRPDESVLATPLLMRSRIERFDAAHPKIKLYINPEGPVQVFVPIGRVILNGEPSLAFDGYKDQIPQIHRELEALINTGIMPGYPHAQEAINSAFQSLMEQPCDEAVFCC